MFGCACMFRRPKTGIYGFRRAVPKDLRAILGKTEITKSRSLYPMNKAASNGTTHRIASGLDEFCLHGQAGLMCLSAVGALTAFGVENPRRTGSS